MKVEYRYLIFLDGESIGIRSVEYPLMQKETIYIKGDKYLIFEVEHHIDENLTRVYADKM